MMVGVAGLKSYTLCIVSVFFEPQDVQLTYQLTMLGALLIQLGNLCWRLEGEMIRIVFLPTIESDTTSFLVIFCDVCEGGK